MNHWHTGHLTYLSVYRLHTAKTWKLHKDRALPIPCCSPAPIRRVPGTHQKFHRHLLMNEYSQGKLSGDLNEKVPKANVNRLRTAARTCPRLGASVCASLADSEPLNQSLPEPQQPTCWAESRHSDASAEAHAWLWHYSSTQQRARAVKIEQILSTLLLANLTLGTILQLKHLNRNAKIQACKQRVCYSKLMNTCFPNSKVHKTTLMHFI